MQVEKGKYYCNTRNGGVWFCPNNKNDILIDTCGNRRMDCTGGWAGFVEASNDDIVKDFKRCCISAAKDLDLWEE